MPAIMLSCGAFRPPPPFAGLAVLLAGPGPVPALALAVAYLSVPSCFASSEKSRTKRVLKSRT